MRAVLTRVRSASVTIDGHVNGSIGRGFLILLGVGPNDTERECRYLAEKALGLRVFEDENGKMNLALADVGGAMMVVSNFTLYADCSHGRRPDFFRAARPEEAIPVYERFVEEVRARGISLITGEFGADMAIDHVNDGPVTLILDTDQMLKKDGGQGK